MKPGFYRFIIAIARVIFHIFLPWCAKGASHMPCSGAAILCANHQSLADPVFAACSLARPVRFMGKQELFEVKPLGAFLRAVGAFPVQRGARDIAAVRTALQVLKAGDVLGIFPEGQRQFKGDTGFQTGVALIALRSGAPVVPLYIASRARLFHTVRIAFGAPVDLTDFGGMLDAETLRKATARIEDAVSALAETVKS